MVSTASQRLALLSKDVFLCHAQAEVPIAGALPGADPTPLVLAHVGYD